MKQFEDKAAGQALSDIWTSIEWHESTSTLNLLITSMAELTFSPLSPGLEAEVAKITHGENQYVLKVWNKRSKPDVQRQYRLLETLQRQKIRVSEPIGYGKTEDGHAVLLTRHHGTPVTKVSPSIFKKITSVLADVHRLPADGLMMKEVPKYDFINYFFSGIEAYPAMKENLIYLVHTADMKMDRIIHGDFNLGNILEEDGQYTVIDWTNGQLGDPRFDLSWACLLLRIYVSDSKSLTFLYKYQEEIHVDAGELEIFEAIACLRWLLLDRIAGVPKYPDTMKNVRKIVRNNRFLNENVEL
ncbi:aminoglycoside phosphotransferase family protein [Paenibacillus qinlingensis]|uniref:aminoglycoside phosphotransferase family protein n=1 Tax=Paenibacillus qinlingensis TaxID=1837343 RepID=UPI001563DA9B|nr:aminoglycoside phosphotransferase family protein [Paenibacillus qinlingensis]NQX58101.1 aminoglycoside phosphotransferase family protein [Paenibacillus qinlingensis]